MRKLMSMALLCLNLVRRIRFDALGAFRGVKCYGVAGKRDFF